MFKTALNLLDSAGFERRQAEFAAAIGMALATRRMRARFIDHSGDRSLSDAKWSALYMLAISPAGLTQTELAERVGIEGPTVVRLVDALEEQGLALRTPDPDDRRAKLVVITEAGKGVRDELDLLAAEFRRSVFANVSDADLQTFVRVLSNLTEVLEGGSARETRAAVGQR